MAWSHRWLICTFAIAGAVRVGAAGTGTFWHVDDDAPGDPGPQNPLVGDPNEDGSTAHPFDRIQEAINAAVSGDSILVEPGLYVELGTVDLGSKNLTIIGVSGAQQTIIDMINWNDQVMQIAGGQNSSTIIDGLTLKNGRALGASPNDRGAGLHCTGSPTVRNCVFIGNQAVSGGGVYATGAALTLSDCHFQSNHATEGGGAFLATAITMSGCEFVKNTATNMGGAMRFMAAQGLVSRCEFTSNSALTGGALEIFGLQSSVPSFRDCKFAENSSTQGGAVRLQVTGPPSSTWMNCIFFNNTCTGNGGAVFVQEGIIDFTNCTFSGNVSESGGGGAIHRGGLGSPRVQNCIAWGNLPTGFNTPMTVTYCNVQEIMPGVGNISADPIFADAAKGDFHLLEASPCIDAGNSTVVPLAIAGDYETLPRVINSLVMGATGVPAFGYFVDMGAYEFQGQPVDPPDACPADIAPLESGGNGLVNVDDLLMVINAWGACTK